MNPNHLSIAMHHFLLSFYHSLRECRGALYDFSIESNFYHGLGLITAALNLEAIEYNQHVCLAEMLINAAALRREELISKQPAHSRIALTAYQAKRAEKERAA